MKMPEINALVKYLETNGLRIVTAESCTAGLIASTLAEPPGSGQWLECAFVTYSEDSKMRCLEVDQKLIDEFGLTSEPVAKAMSEGALAHSHATAAIATTGVAGPSAGDGKVPVGTVCIAWSFKCSDGVESFAETRVFAGDRNAVRESASAHAIRNIVTYHQMLPKSCG